MNGVASKATVVRLEDDGSGRNKVTFPIFEFPLPGNFAKITAKSYTAVGLDQKRRQKPVEVVYSPSNPQVVLPRKHLLFWIYILVWVWGAILLGLLTYGFHEIKKSLSPAKK